MAALASGNIAVHEFDTGPALYLYAHWHGWELPRILAEALDSSDGRRRWTDAPYLGRIIFEHLLRYAEGETEKGFGISLGECEPQAPTVHLYVESQSVRWQPAGGEPVNATYEDFITAELGREFVSESVGEAF